MAHRYPILLDVTTRRIVIVGGGRVAARKARGLIDAGATQLVAIAPDFDVVFPLTVHRIRRAYHPDDLAAADLVFAATDRPEVNEQVVRDARARGVLVNRADADDDHPGDFVTPARLVEQNVIVSVSAASAALAAGIRDGLHARWDPRWTRMADAMQALRPWIREHASLSPAQRTAIFRLLAGDEAMDILANHGLPALRAWLVERHPELRN